MFDRTASPEPLTPQKELRSACQVCGRSSDSLLHFNELHPHLQEIVRANTPTSGGVIRVCPHCIELFSRAKAQLDAHAAIFAQTEYVLPTPLRLDVDERFTGRGVTIAFLDSGFYGHPDLTKPVNRIVAYKNIFQIGEGPNLLDAPDVASWHGMMTSVVAAGNGHLSDGFYRSIAPEAKVVLVKIGKTGRIPEINIERGLQWILKNREKYAIQIVNISAGGDFEQPYLHNALSRSLSE
jgi:serine protease AprX